MRNGMFIVPASPAPAVSSEATRLAVTAMFQAQAYKALGRISTAQTFEAAVEILAELGVAVRNTQKLEQLLEVAR